MQADWVGGDAAYGNSSALRQALQQRGQAYVLDVGPGLHLYLANPTPAAAPVWSAGPAPAPGQAAGHGAGLARGGGAGPANAWQTVRYRLGQKGPLVRQAVLLPIWCWKAGYETGLLLQLLVSCELDGT